MNTPNPRCLLSTISRSFQLRGCCADIVHPSLSSLPFERQSQAHLTNRLSLKVSYFKGHLKDIFTWKLCYSNGWALWLAHNAHLISIDCLILAAKNSRRRCNGRTRLRGPLPGCPEWECPSVPAHFRPRERTAALALDFGFSLPGHSGSKWGLWSQVEVLPWGKSGKMDKKGTIQNFLAGKQNFIQNLTIS